MAKIFNLLLSFVLFFPFYAKNPIQNQPQNLSPATELKETKRLPFSLDPKWADTKRETIDPNIFQGYDVRGIALQHGNSKVNLRPVDAFLIAEAIAYTYMNEFHKALGQGTIDNKRNRNATPRILITGDARETSQTLIAAAAKGAALQGFAVHYDSGHVPTGAANFYALRHDYDVMIQITGSHNPFEHNGLKIAVRQNENGFFDPNGKLGALYGNQGKRPFELKTIYETITQQAEVIKKSRVQTPAALQDIAGFPLDVEDSYLDRFSNRPKYGAIVQTYVDALKKRFGKLKTGRRLVVDPGNGMGAAVIPILEHQGHTIEAGIYLEVKGRPDHPADPSKDTAGKKEIAESGCRACVEAVKRFNSQTAESELPVIGVLTDGDGDRSGLVDEEGKVIRPSAIATLIYRRFILENKETLKKLEKMGQPITLALDVCSSNVLEKITGVITPEGTILKKGLYDGVRGISIPAPSHRDHVAKEIKKLLELRKGVCRGQFNHLLDNGGKDSLPFLDKINDLINSFVSAEASGHYFAATDLTHPDTMIDDGIFYAARVLEILDTWNDFEGKDPNITVPHKGVYLLKDIFSPDSIPTLPAAADSVNPQGKNLLLEASI